MGILWLGSRIVMGNRPMKTRDISGRGKTAIPSKNVLNTTLVTQVEVIEDGVVKFYNWGKRSKVYAMLEDTHRTLRIYINNKNQKDEPIESDVL
jgi:hypothetical protein